MRNFVRVNILIRHLIYNKTVHKTWHRTRTDHLVSRTPTSDMDSDLNKSQAYTTWTILWSLTTICKDMYDQIRAFIINNIMQSTAPPMETSDTCPPRTSSKITFVVYHIYFQSPDGMPEWDHQNTPIIFAAVGIGIIFVLLIASRNSFQLN